MSSAEDQMALVAMGLVGSTVRIAVNGEELEGEVFAVDPNLDTIVVRQEGLYGACNLRIVPWSQVDLKNATPPAVPVKSELPKVDLARAKAREEDAVLKAEQSLHKIGVGVGREAQDIFEALDKTMPCRWEDSDIVVLDEVRIKPPYDIASCSTMQASAHAQKALERVKVVLGNELSRLAKA